MGSMSEERRSLPRFSVNDQILLEVLHGGGFRFLATLTDYSAKGLRVSLAQPLSAGTPVSLKTEGLLILGEVVWCKPIGDGYEAGIELEQMLDTNELRVLIAGMSS